MRPGLRPILALLAACYWLGAVPSAPAQEVKWRHDYAAARREAVEKGRPIVIDFGTENCMWCKQLDLRTFRDAAVVEVLNEGFIPLKIDAQREADLAKRLRISSYPTIVIASPEGRILDTIEGFREAAPFQEHLQRALALVSTPEWMTRDYQQAVRAAPTDPAQAAALLRKIIEDRKERPVQVQARQLLADVERQLQARSDAAMELRPRRARDLLAQAREDFRAQQFLSCLERCEALTALYGDLPEAAEGHQLAAQIKNNPDWMKQACEVLSDRLCLLYLALADSWLKNGQPHQAVMYLEKVVQTFPGTRHAEAAQIRLMQIQGTPTQSVDFKDQ